MAAKRKTVTTHSRRRLRVTAGARIDELGACLDAAAKRIQALELKAAGEAAPIARLNGLERVTHAIAERLDALESQRFSRRIDAAGDRLNSQGEALSALQERQQQHSERESLLRAGYRELSAKVEELVSIATTLSTTIVRIESAQQSHDRMHAETRAYDESLAGWRRAHENIQLRHTQEIAALQERLARISEPTGETAPASIPAYTPTEQHLRDQIDRLRKQRNDARECAQYHAEMARKAGWVVPEFKWDDDQGDSAAAQQQLNDPLARPLDWRPMALATNGAGNVWTKPGKPEDSR